MPERCGRRGLAGSEVGGVEGRRWEGERGDAGQIGVKAEEEGMVRLEGGCGAEESFGG